MVEAASEVEDVLFVPATLLVAIEGGHIDPAVARFFAPPPWGRPSAGGPPPDHFGPESDPGEFWLGVRAWLEQPYVRTYEPSEGDLGVLADAGSVDIAERLQTSHPGLVGQILFEEWVFLQSHSWIASRTKRVFSTFIREGAVAIEAGRRSYDQAAARAQVELPQLVTRHGVKRMARWFATTAVAWEIERNLPGGGLLHALLASGASSVADKVTGGATKRVFVLIDP